MITVTRGKDGKDFKRTWPNNQIDDVCLNFAGGGWTAKQTEKAMIAKFELMWACKTKLCGYKIVMTYDEGCIIPTPTPQPNKHNLQHSS